MPDIYHDFPITAHIEPVYAAISTPAGLDCWWTKRCRGNPTEGAVYELWFGPEYDWRARVTKAHHASEFEIQITDAHPDWLNTRLGFRLGHDGKSTNVHFYHTGWPEANEHWRISCYCWAMYLRIMRRYLEHGDVVPYENRLDV